MTKMQHNYLKYFLSYLIAVVTTLLSPTVANAFSITNYTDKSVLSEGKWVRVKVSKDGMYRITKSDISKWGFSNLNDIRVFGYGGEPLSDVLSLAEYIDDLPQTPVIRTESSIIFFGKGPESWSYTPNDKNGLVYKQIQPPYSTAGYYFITENNGIEDITYEKQTGATQTGVSTDTFIERLFHEQELTSPGMTGRLLLGEDFKYSTSQTFHFELTDLVPGKISVSTAFATKVMNGSSSLSFKSNGTAVDGGIATSISPVIDAAHEHVKRVVATKYFDHSDTDLMYSVIFSYRGTLFTANLDYITVNYTRKLQMNGNEFFFRGSDAKSFNLQNTSSNTRILEITNPENPIEMGTTLNGTTSTFASNGSGNHEFIAFNPDATFPAPEFVETVSNQNLHGEAIPNMIIITPGEFETYANQIADMHSTKDGMRVLVVTPQKIYNEFSSGMPDINAYRRLAKMFRDRGKELKDTTQLGYLLLFGRSSYDNREITEKVKGNKYPRLLNWQSEEGDSENTSYNTDDILGFLEDNSGKNFGVDKLSIAVGRMPVKSTTEAKQMVEKLLKYIDNTNTGSWKNDILIIADDEDNGVHMTQSDEFITNLQSGGGSNFMYKHLYTDAFTATSIGAGRNYPDARKKMFDEFSKGVLWANYIGHANPQSWTHDGLLTTTDIQNNFYYKNLPLLCTATCEFTRWDSDEISGGELLFLNTAGGAIALITTSRIVYISNNGVLSNYIGAQALKKVDNQYQRIGDILKNAKNSYTRSDDNKLRYMLIGDPAMRLTYPTHTIRLEEINGKSIDNNEEYPILEASSTVEISGSVYAPDGNKATDFNGIITPRLYDAESSIVTNGYGEYGIEHLFYEHSNLLYIGQDSIRNGEFKIRFNMPSEISNNYSPALFNFYACSNNGIEANGATDELYVYGYSEQETSDTEGPEIKLFALNSTSFENGGTVNDSPLVLAEFTDSSGINISTAGIGHQISLLLDNETTYEDVSNYYTPEIGGNGGSITYQLSDLSEGHHTLRLRVWDIANNSSTKEIEFNVVKGLAPELCDVYTTANPASVDANFYITHNRPESFITVRLEVFDLMGRPVWSTEESGKSDMFTSFPINWNLCDNAGRRVSRGIYIYRATIFSSDGGESKTKSKKIAVTAQ